MINFQRTFGAESGNVAGAAAGQQREEAKVWLNIGYNVTVENAEGQPEDVFVSLPVGIPVDTCKHIDVSKIRNARMLQLAVARNELLDEVLNAAKTLEPGNGQLVDLSIQLRRVSNPSTAADAGSENPFKRTAAPARQSEDA